MVGHLVHAVVGDVGDGHAKFGGGVHRNVVHTDAEPADGDAVWRGPQHVGRDLGEAGHYGIHVSGEGDERILLAVRRDNGLGVRFLSENGLFRLGRRPDVIGDKDFEFGHQVAS